MNCAVDFPEFRSFVLVCHRLKRVPGPGEVRVEGQGGFLTPLLALTLLTSPLTMAPTVTSSAQDVPQPTMLALQTNLMVTP